MQAFGPPPRRVRAGDTVAVVSPSFGGVGAWPHRAQRGCAYLESLGLRIRMMPHAYQVDSWVSAPAEARADDLHAAFADNSVAVVLSSIGGNHSNQVLPYLDYDLIAAHPKIFHAYSDTTVLAWAFAGHAGLRSFYRPPLVLGMAEYPKVLPYTDRWLRAAWFGTEPLDFVASEEWTEEVLDFDTRADLERGRHLEPNPGWTTVREGSAHGPLIGGCMETIWLASQGVERVARPPRLHPLPGDVRRSARTGHRGCLPHRSRATGRIRRHLRSVDGPTRLL